MTDRVPVTVVVPVRNEADRIAGFVQAHQWASEIIVVDNGSTDATARLAAEGGATVLSFPDVTTGEARNRGAEAAHTSGSSRSTPTKSPTTRSPPNCGPFCRLPMPSHIACCSGTS